MNGEERVPIIWMVGLSILAAIIAFLHIEGDRIARLVGA